MNMCRMPDCQQETVGPQLFCLECWKAIPYKLRLNFKWANTARMKRITLRRIFEWCKEQGQPKEQKV